ncbi:MAG: triose-phosphate isomerase [Thermoplasmatota archaeon]
MGSPLVLVNYKVYAEATGARALTLTKALEAAAARHAGRAVIAVAPQLADLQRVASATRLPVFAQHVDALAPGVGTGHVLAESVRDAGAVGSLVNHAERRLGLAEIEAIVARCRAASLVSVVCTNNAASTRSAAALEPDFVAVEPPELIGGNVSVTTADPDIVRQSVAGAKRSHPTIRVLCGAGIKNGADLAAALRLGCDGVLLASGIVKAKDPGAALDELLRGLG